MPDEAGRIEVSLKLTSCFKTLNERGFIISWRKRIAALFKEQQPRVNKVAEINADGSLVVLRHYPLEFYGTGSKAAGELQNTVHEIVTQALERGKYVVIVEPDFGRKKAECKWVKTLSGKIYPDDSCF